MKWRPRISYGATPTVLDLELPQRPWDFAPQAVGGSRRAASGVGAAYTVRHDELVDHTIRFDEDEWPAVRAWLLWAQDLGTFAWRDDQDDVGTLDTVTLESPRKGEPVRPQRSAEYPLAFEITITLRHSAAYTRAYFPFIPDPTHDVFGYPLED